MKRLSMFLAVGGVIALIGAALWNPLAAPKLVKFPANADLTMHYTGTLQTYQLPGEQLTTPLQVPLQIDRRIQTIGSKTGAQVALVQETVTVHAGTTVQTQTQVYALDRRSMKNVANPGAYAFVPGNVVDRSGSYTINLPMGVADKGTQFPIFEAETGKSYNLMASSNATGNLDGLRVVHLAGGYAFTPVTAADQAGLAATGLPTQLSPQEVAAQLGAAGIQLDQAFTTLPHTLTPTEMATVVKALSSPVPLQYFSYGSGQATVGDRTGMIVQLTNVIDGVAAKADLSGFQPVVAVLAKHADVPAIASLIATLGRFASAPAQRVYDMQFSQTPASVSAMVKEAKSRTRTMNMATTGATRLLIGLGTLLLAAGTILFLVASRKPFVSAQRHRLATTEAASQRPAA